MKKLFYIHDGQKLKVHHFICKIFYRLLQYSSLNESFLYPLSSHEPDFLKFKSIEEIIKLLF